MPAARDTPLDSVAATVAILGLFVLLGATLTAVVNNRPDGRGIPTREPAAPVLAEPPAPVLTGTALIDAIPWGRVERIESAAGERYRIPTPAETPLVIDLPLGEWIVALSHPDQEEERLCELSIERGSRTECLVEFEPLSVDQYFRDAGWWR